MKITPWLAGSLMLLAAGTAQAFTAAPGPIAAAPDASIIQVRGGCGFGEHRGPMWRLPLEQRTSWRHPPSADWRPAWVPARNIRGPRGFCHF